MKNAHTQKQDRENTTLWRPYVAVLCKAELPIKWTYLKNKYMLSKLLTSST